MISSYVCISQCCHPLCHMQIWVASYTGFPHITVLWEVWTEGDVCTGIYVSRLFASSEFSHKATIGIRTEEDVFEWVSSREYLSNGSIFLRHNLSWCIYSLTL